MKKLYFLFLLTSAGVFAQGSLCDNPIVIASLPYTTTDDTANYLDTYDPQTDTHPTCSTTLYGNYYHSGNDVIYALNVTTDGTISVEIPAAIAWTGMFLYNNCADIGVTYAACATGPTAGARVISNFAVTAGQTYYILVSSWSTPQTVAYTLNVTGSVTLAVNTFEEATFAIYPNPVSDVLHLETKSKINAFSVYNLNGQKLDVQLANDTDLSVGHLQSGFYVLELTTNEGTFSKKFIKL